MLVNIPEVAALAVTAAAVVYTIDKAYRFIEAVRFDIRMAKREREWERRDAEEAAKPAEQPAPVVNPTTNTPVVL